MKGATFEQNQPELQRFLNLICIGYHQLGMFSADIDAIWHSLILSTQRYQDFCEQFNAGKMIHHLPQLEPKKYQQCTVCQSCANCSIKCKDKCSEGDGGGDDVYNIGAERNVAAYFRQAYIDTYGMEPSVLYNLPMEIMA